MLGTVIIKDKVVCRILQSPGKQTLQGICQQPVILTGNPTGWDALKYLIYAHYWTTATPVDSITNEAMGYSFGLEDLNTKKERPALMRERAVSLWREAHSQSSLGSHREKEQQNCGSIFGCAEDGLGLATKPSGQTDSLWNIWRLIFP